MCICRYIYECARREGSLEKYPQADSRGGGEEEGGTVLGNRALSKLLTSSFFSLLLVSSLKYIPICTYICWKVSGRFCWGAKDGGRVGFPTGSLLYSWTSHHWDYF